MICRLDTAAGLDGVPRPGQEVLCFTAKGCEGSVREALGVHISELLVQSRSGLHVTLAWRGGAECWRHLRCISRLSEPVMGL